MLKNIGVACNYVSSTQEQFEVEKILKGILIYPVQLSISQTSINLVPEFASFTLHLRE